MTDAASSFATLPEPPYYVVIFSSQRRPGDDGYGAMAERMVDLAARQPGYLGMESVRGADGFGITNSFWKDEDSIRAWNATSTISTLRIPVGAGGMSAMTSASPASSAPIPSQRGWIDRFRSLSIVASEF